MEWGGAVVSEVLAAAGSSVREALGVKDDLERLQLTLSTVNTLMDQAEWWRFTDAGADVVALFTKFKDVKYDAEDVLDAFHYQELIEGMSNSSKVTQAVNRVSHFVREASSNLVKGVLSGKYNGVKDILEKMESVTGKLKEEIEKLDPKRPQIIKRIAAIRKTSSEITESHPLGREKEKEIVINTLLQLGDHSNSSDEHGHGCSSLPNKRRKKANVSVLPIVGMGGLGKTTLAQMVYNDPSVDKHFQLTLWVCVRDEFDVKKIINKILKSASEKMPELNEYTIPHFKLKKMLSKKFLLVLDDVWCEDRLEWEKLYKPLSKEHNGSVILVTTRSPKVPSVMGTENPITLKGLDEKPFWDFFERCAFISEGPEDHPHLVNIAKEHITKLKGSPLAAKTLGALLSTELDTKHWMYVMDSEMWKVDRGENGIMPALRLSYQYLTTELKRCFSFCFMFRKDYSFHKSRMVAKWVAHGLIVPQGYETLEERGAKCFDELASRSFFQSSPRYDGMYVIHDLMHDLAQSISKDECFCIQASDSQQIVPESIRHLSVARHLIEEMKLGKYSKLRSLEVLHPANRFSNELLFFSSNFSFSQLPLVRMLDLRYCGIKILPESLGDMKHLRYLDLSDNRVEVLPEFIERLLKLQYLNISGNNLINLPKGLTKLISLRNLFWDRFKIPVILGIGKLTSLQNLLVYHARRIDGQTIGELKNMTQLYEKLVLNHLEEVKDKEEAAQAMLTNKRYLHALELNWSKGRNIDQCADEEVLEGLQPRRTLKSLEIISYGGLKPPSWLQAQFLPYINELCIKDCVNLIAITDLPPCLTKLHLENCPCFTSLAVDNLTALREFYIRECQQLQVIQGLNPPSLKNLSIIKCPNLMELGAFMPENEGKGNCRSKLEVLVISDTSLLKLQSLRGALASLLTLEIVWCTETLVFDGDEQELFQDLKSLTRLVFRCCHNLQLVPQNLHGIPSLQKLELSHCTAIKLLPENGVLPFIISHFNSGCNLTFD